MEQLAGFSGANGREDLLLEIPFQSAVLSYP